ncbi:MAG: acyl-CoA desaturase [Candidatus Omnitrophota bacterium]
MNSVKSGKKLVWKNILFFGITSLLALVGVPLYAHFVGFKKVDWAIFTFMAVATMMSTTFGYHRLFAHRAFKAHPFVIFLNLFFGAATFGGSVLNWASGHRIHHKYTDTEDDPYNIKEGFWHAHMGWFLSRKEKIVDYDNVKDLSANKFIKHQHDHYALWAVGTGIALPLAVGYAAGSFWGAFFLGVCGRLFFIHQSIFLINSACHMLGKATYSLDESARDSWVCALLTHGEGYHSYHHRFPSDFRNGVRWYQWDPTKWMVKLLGLFGLAWDLNQTPEVKILAARTETEHLRFIGQLNQERQPASQQVEQYLNEFYASLSAKLKVWEARVLEYQQMCRKVTHDSMELLKQKARQIEEARQDFLNSRKEWLDLLERFSATLAQAA